jgi:hopanoid biosynthesis associated RND transporter like protein HpnN
MLRPPSNQQPNVESVTDPNSAKTTILQTALVRTIDFCTHHAGKVISVALLLTAISLSYAVHNFAISTDVSKLLSSDIPWRQREADFERAFPQRNEIILVVVQAPTPELTKLATDDLAQSLAKRPEIILSIRQVGAGPFFETNGLLYLSAEEVTRVTQQLTQAGPLISRLAANISLSGVMEAIQLGIMGVRAGQLQLDDAVRPMTTLSETIENVLARQPASFSWRTLMNGGPPGPGQLRSLIEVKPVLDYSDLEPGRAASTAIRQAAVDLNLASKFRATVRLTGPIALADEEFATVKQGAFINTSLTIFAVLIILWLALRSMKIIAAVFISLMVGLAMTAAVGLMMVEALNLISVAFAALFVGIGVDFGIQFSVRYRAERHQQPDLRKALLRTAATVGAPLTLAAAATAAGFMSFLPTHYRGLSELGLIAGTGMIIAFVTSVTLLPSLLKLFNPAGEPEPLGYAGLAPVDRFLDRYRIPIIIGTAIVVAAGLPLLSQLRFDFNPINLRNPSVESVATFLELRRDPATGINSIAILASSLAEADTIASKLARLPEVARTRTLSSLVPDEQTYKLELIKKTATALEVALAPKASPKVSDIDNVRALVAAAEGLTQVAGTGTSPGAVAARRLAEVLFQLSRASPEIRNAAHQAIVPPLQVALSQLRNFLKAEPVALATLPSDLRRDWITPEGRALVEVAPKGDPNSNEVLRSFARAVLAVEPRATGTPVSIQESGRTIVWAFIQAGFYALLSIALLLWIVLRRFGDVLLTLVPLVLAGVVTMEICVLIGLPLNFANIIALPLLLGVGVAFKIYYVMAWRAGQTSLLQTSLTRAVIFSAMTTATAFGSLWLSNHPGTSSMGKLMALSLLCTLAAAVLFQPALMGRPREKS